MRVPTVGCIALGMVEPLLKSSKIYPYPNFITLVLMIKTLIMSMAVYKTTVHGLDPQQLLEVYVHPIGLL